MAIMSKCQTPGAMFHTEIGPFRVACAVDCPPGVLADLSADDARTLEVNLHNALELVLAPYFRSAPTFCGCGDHHPHPEGATHCYVCELPVRPVSNG